MVHTVSTASIDASSPPSAFDAACHVLDLQLRSVTYGATSPGRLPDRRKP